MRTYLEFSNLMVIRLGFALAGLVFLGCGNSTSQPAEIQRLIPVDTGRIFSVQGYVKRSEVFSIDEVVEEGVTLPANWTLPAQLDSKGPGITWTAPGGVEVADEVEVTVSGVRPREGIALSWTIDDGRPTTRRLGFKKGRREGNTLTFSFRLDRSPASAGVTYRLSFVGLEGRSIRVRSVKGFGWSVVPERLESTVAQPVKMTLGGVTRTARLALVERPIAWEIPAGLGASRLSFSYGVPEDTVGGTEFRVLTTGREVPLFSATVGDSNKGQWHEAGVDLPSETSESEFLLEVVTSVPQDPLVGLPAWGNPEIRPVGKSSLRPDVVLVSIDTLRADHLSSYGYGRPTSPAIDAWAAQSVLFEQAIASAPWTLPSHTSLLTGLMPFTHGVNYPRPAPEDLPYLAQRLRAAGYATTAITGGSYLNPSFGLGRGFDSYFSYAGSLDSELEVQIAAANDWMQARQQSRPSFLFLHTYEVHDPYVAREPWFSQYSGGTDDPRDVLARDTNSRDGDGLRIRNRLIYGSSRAELEEEPVDSSRIGEVVDRYDSGISYMDSLLGPFLEALSKDPGNTIVVLTSDHGEAFGEQGQFGHGSLYDHQLRVPLVIAAPGVVARRVSQQVSSIDIAETILDLAGVDDGIVTDGTSLRSLLEGRTDVHPEVAWSYSALANYGISLRLDGRLKYIEYNSPWPLEGGRSELYDLRRDAAESTDLSASSESIVTSLSARVLQEYEHAVFPARFSITNRSARGETLIVDSPSFHPSVVKSTGEAGAASIVGAGRMRIRVAPQSRSNFTVEQFSRDSFDLRLFSASRDQLLLEEHLVAGEEVSSRHEIQTADLDLVVEIELATSKHGPIGDPVQTDPELEEQLRALGYLD